MRSFTTGFLGELTLTVEQASTLNRLGEYRGKQDLFARQTPETLQSLQQVAIIESSESSGDVSVEPGTGQQPGSGGDFVDMSSGVDVVDVDSAVSDKNIEKDNGLRKIGWEEYGEKLTRRNKKREKPKD